MKYSRDYKQKYNNFMSQLKRGVRERERIASLPSLLSPQQQEPSFSNKFTIPVKRARVLEDSFNVISRVPSSQLSKLKARMWVEFDGEKGLDYGGLARSVQAHSLHSLHFLGSGFIYYHMKCSIHIMDYLNIQQGKVS